MALFDPLTLRSVTLRNRIVVSPMCQYSSDDGFANDWHLVHLGSRAVGGSSLVIAEATAVVPEGRISPQDLGIWKDEHIPFLRRITGFIKQQGAVPGIQLAHAGRKASTRRPWEPSGVAPIEEGGWAEVHAPSEVAFSDRLLTPRAMTVTQIEGLVAAFASAAKRSYAAGFEVVEIHAAHGYLLHEFLSPLSNFRDDAYGGSFENRTRLVKQVVSAIREVWPSELPLLMRVSGTDWTEGGWTVEDTVRLSQEVHTMGVDLIDCSSGGNVPAASIPVGPGYQAHIAEGVKAAGVPAGAVGMITTAPQADALIGDGKADVVLLARQLLRDPYWPLRAAKELDVDIPWPKQYERARD